MRSRFHPPRSGRPARAGPNDRPRPVRALLSALARRLDAAGHSVELLPADFHDLPLPDAGIHLAAAAFCLYHSPHPRRVLSEISRCLVTDGRVVLATKSLDSYREIDELIAARTSTPMPSPGPRLFQSFHSDTVVEITEHALHVEDLVSEQHVFRFADLDHLAAYAATSPKYQLPARLAGNPSALAAPSRC